MTAVPPAVRFRLRPEHLDLVRGALASPSDAVDAYRRWRAAVPLTDTDAGSYRLIPLLHHNLADSGVFSDTEASRYAKMTRFTWVKSQLILDRARTARSVLQDASIASLQIKGLAALHHSGLGADLRPMDDADLLVGIDDAVGALHALHAAGFTSEEVDLADVACLSPLIAGHHGLNLRDSSGVQVDLHWHGVPHALHREADRGTWERSAEGFPSLEDAFVHVLAHATRWSWAPSVQWLSDAVLLTRKHLDWSLVTDELMTLRIGVPCADALAVVSETELTDIPAWVMTRLHRAPVIQRLEARVRRRGDGTWRPSNPAERFADGFGEHVRRTVPPTAALGAGQLGSYLLERWALDRLRQIPAHLVGVAARPSSAMSRVVRPVLEVRPDVTAPTRSIEVGAVQRFTLGGNALDLLGRGWSFPENHGTWTIGSEAALGFEVADAPSSAGTLQLRFDVVPFLCDRVPSRRIDVVVNGQRLARWSFTGTQWSPQQRVVVLPTSDGTERTYAVRFVVHQPISPQAVDHDVGTRQLGMSLAALVVQE